MKSRLQNHQGFTLIEIIAVIVILAVIVAVAVPKYFEMTDEARAAALDGALSEAVSRFNHAYTRFIVSYKRAPQNVAELHSPEYLGADAGTQGVGESIGDFRITWRAHPTHADAILIFVESAATIPGLDTLPDAMRSKELFGIVWASAVGT